MSDFQKTFSGRSVFLTGHSGFKGSWLSFWLSELGAKVTGFSLDPDEGQRDLFEVVQSGGAFEKGGDVRGDIRDPEAVHACLAETKPEFVFHLAAQSLVRRSYALPRETMETNVMGTANLLEAVRASAPEATVVIVTSDKCYENQEWTYAYRENEPLGGKDVYSASKAAAEMVAASWRHSFFRTESNPGKVATARGGNVIGGGDFA
ncbi:MAG: CDP-glucose 4,6-dehydratase, partial [Verrucomicrobiota bacterium]